MMPEQVDDSNTTTTNNNTNSNDHNKNNNATDVNNNNDDDNDDDSEKGDRILSLIDSAKAAASLRDRQEYESRLLTFRASTYYAKPPCLSPLFCARFGWRNVDNDMLGCSACPSVLAITLNSKLSNQSFNKLCSAYRDKVVSNHGPTCPFRLTTVEFQKLLNAGTDTALSTESNNPTHSHGTTTTMTTNAMVVPPYMAAVLPEECIRLMDHPTPSLILRDVVRQLIAILPTTTTATVTNSPTTTADASPTGKTLWTYPKLVVPTEIRRLSLDAAELLGLDGSDNNESIVALAVMGWTPIEKLIDSVPVVSLGCPLCLSFMELRLEPGAAETTARDDEQGGHNEEEDRSGAERQAKRLRQLSRYCNPLDAHRHYCPYKSGFPNSSMDRPTPIWQVIVQRLCQEVKHCTQNIGGDDGLTSNGTSDLGGAMEESALDASINRVRKILGAGIASRTVDLGD